MATARSVKFSVLLDSDVIVAEQFLRSPSARALLLGSRILNFRIVIPEIVLDEVLGIYARSLKNAIEHHREVGKELANLIQYSPSSYRFKEEFEAYKNWLFEQIREFDIVVLKYPELPPKELVTQNYAGHPLFDRNPDGYNDYLLWRSICDWLGANPVSKSGPCHFATASRHVFCQHTLEGWELHEALQQESSVGEDAFELTFSLKELFAHTIKPRLPSGVVEEIDVIYYIQSRFDEELEKLVQEKLTNTSANGFEGLPLDDITLTKIQDILPEEVVWTRLSSQEMHVYCNGTMEITVEGYLKRSDLWSIDMEEDDITIIDLEYQEDYARAACVMEVTFEFVAVFDRQQARLVTHDLVLLEEMLPENYV